MKTLAELEENIYKCSKCGLCQHVCPVYKATGNECTLSRGKFVLLNGVIQKHIKLDKNVLKYVDLCLNCNACKNYCPSNIDAREIFTGVKCEHRREHRLENKNIFKEIFASYKFFKMALICVGLAFKTYRFLKIDKLVCWAQNFIMKFGKSGKLVLLANSIVIQNVKRKKNNFPFSIFHFPFSIKSSKKTTIVYFQGCVNKYLNPSAKNAVLNLLEELDCEVVTAGFECCGISYYTKGMADKVSRLANINLSKIPDDFDYFLTDCASCAFMLSNYGEFAGEALKPKAALIAEKSINILDLLSKLGYKKSFKTLRSCTFHKPCHYDGEIKNLLKNIENLEYKEMEGYDSCCGAAGDFAVRYQDISQKISSTKAKNALAADTDIILTACPSCVIGLKQGLLEQGNTQKPVMNFVEFLNLS